MEADGGSQIDFGQTQIGRRGDDAVKGGRVARPRLQGRCRVRGPVWQFPCPDDTADLDASYAIPSDSGALIYRVNRSVRHGPAEVCDRLNWIERTDAAAYYFRSTAGGATYLAESPSRSGRWRNIPRKVMIRFWELS